MSASDTHGSRMRLVAALLGSAICVAFLVIIEILGAPWWFFAAISVAASVFGVGLFRAPPGRRLSLAGWPRRIAGGLAQGDFLTPAELPVPSSPFVGRDNEIAAMAGFLSSVPAQSSHVIVISGPPGIGKTALALHFAHSVAGFFPDGQLFADLANLPGLIEDASSVESSFVEALQGPDGLVPQDPRVRHDRYLELAADRRLLIMLDDARNPEEIRRLLPRGPSCLVVVTSRAPLDLEAGQFDIQLGPLGDDSALRLLGMLIGEDRVARDISAAREIAGNSAGYPLAVRLAGASLATRQYWGLGRASLRMNADKNQVGLAEGTESFNGLLDMSYAMLTEDERHALRSLGLLEEPVFEPWMLAALIRENIPPTLRLTESLVRERLIERVSEDSDEALRYRVHEHVLAYARLRLRAETKPDEQERALRRLVEARLRRLERVPAQRIRKKVFLWQDEGKFAMAQDAARDALALAQMKGDKEAEGLALSALAELYLELGYINDARELAMAALDAPGPSCRPRAERTLGKVRRRLRQIPEAEAVLIQARGEARELGDHSELIRVLRELAATQALGDDPAAGLATAADAIQLCDQRDDGGKRLLAGVLWSKGTVLLRAGSPGGAAAAFEEGERVANEAGQVLWAAWIGEGKARVALAREEFGDSKALAAQTLERFLEIHHRYGVARCRMLLGETYRKQGRADEAARPLEEALETFQNCGDPWIAAVAMRTLALNRLEQGDAGDAAGLLENAYQVFESLGDELNRRNVRSELISSPILWNRLTRFGEKLGAAVTRGA